METVSPEEAYARVIWAAHILAYLSRGRSQPDLIRTDDHAINEDEEGNDFDSVFNDVLTNASENLRTKFLDSIARVLSHTKGWNHVTVAALREYEDRVEIDVARNEGFNVEDEAFIDSLEEFLSAQGEDKKIRQESASGRFLYALSKYWSGRLMQLFDELRNLFKSLEIKPEAPRRFTEISTLLAKVRSEPSNQEDSTLELVQLAYKLVHSEFELEDLLRHLGKGNGQNTRRALRIVAQPMTLCHILSQVARTLPQFQHISVVKLLPRREVRIGKAFVIPIGEAWERLRLPQADRVIWKFFNKNDRDFRKDCSRDFRTHAEIQLQLRYEEDKHLRPTIDYLGCSKKACLLCESFLALPPILLRTGGRHGMCYSAWGLPQTSQKHFHERLIRLSEVLTERVQQCISENIFCEAVSQTVVGSSVNDADIEDLDERAKAMAIEKQYKESIRAKDALMHDPSSAKPRRADQERAIGEEQESCVICDASPARQDDRCKSAWYCSTQCQEVDWPSHKLLCRKYSSARSSRPTKRHRLAILFPPDKVRPKLVWVLCEKKSDEFEGSRECAQLSTFLGNDMDRRHVQRVPSRDRDLDDTIEVAFRGMFLKDGSKSNRSLYASIGTAGTMNGDWRGPIIILAKPGIGRDPPDYRDITLHDFRYALDYFISYSDSSVRAPVSGSRRTNKCYWCSGDLPRGAEAPWKGTIRGG
ncbi:hypothetical protein K469DRAFT_694128 [Zopfia rhizophila CBS 207.26]|uniref:MYND-type domain-containing protein n=1 Tax=Zopfia rhizophila CBS 207.26 TaxID=1314779 RepID=A0A6A6DLX8_9PEZI|nr:hypothetical protein K469DRAFT_694128 [Zopfia rhizophila CBS 207.26]